MTMSAKQHVTSDKQQIPRHYVPLSSFGCHSGDRPATPEYLALSAAWKSKSLSGWKLMSTPNDIRGRVFVDPAEASEILAGHRDSTLHAGVPAQEKATLGATKKFSDDPEYSDLREGVLACSAVIRHWLLVQSPGYFDCVNEATASIERIEKVLERLALAVESIATQPAGSWRDMNGEVMN
jgi:hypothetical protein